MGKVKQAIVDVEEEVMDIVMSRTSLTQKTDSEDKLRRQTRETNS